MGNPGTGNGWPHIGGRETLTEQVYRALRARLVRGDYAPGTFIREPDLCAGMRVSRTPVREALNRLASDGLIERIPQRGFRVPQQSIDVLVHLYPVLGALEGLAGELAFPKLAEAEIAELEETNERFAAALAGNDATGAIRWNEEFHIRLARWSGNPILGNFIEDLRGQVRRLEMWEFTQLLDGSDGVSPDSRDRWARQHREIIHAVREQRFDQARELLRANCSLFFEHEIRQSLERSQAQST